MTNEARRKDVLDRIKQNIAEHGHHTYVVTGGGDPHYAYTIGLRESLGSELILAAAYFYSLDDVPKIIDIIAAKLEPRVDWEGVSMDVGPFGSFSLRRVHESWTTMLMLGAIDYYHDSSTTAFQIVPDAPHWTIDVPNLDVPWSAATAPAWSGPDEPWKYPVPASSVALTNLGALRGHRITEAMRWEEDEWELFAGTGPDIPKEEIRVVPLRTLLTADETLYPIVSLDVGHGLWRDATSEWHRWGADQE